MITLSPFRFPVLSTIFLSFYYLFSCLFLPLLYQQHHHLPHLLHFFLFLHFLFFILVLFFFLLSNASLSLPRIHNHQHHSRIHTAMASQSLSCHSVSISLLHTAIPCSPPLSFAAAASLSLPARLPFSRSLSHSVFVISLSLLVSFCLRLKTESPRSELWLRVLDMVRFVKFFHGLCLGLA
jgi:hypothetical protein